MSDLIIPSVTINKRVIWKQSIISTSPSVMGLKILMTCSLREQLNVCAFAGSRRPDHLQFNLNGLVAMQEESSEAHNCLDDIKD
jgi:hypothetical protein